LGDAVETMPDGQLRDEYGLCLEHDTGFADNLMCDGMVLACGSKGVARPEHPIADDEESLKAEMFRNLEHFKTVIQEVATSMNVTKEDLGRYMKPGSHPPDAACADVHIDFMKHALNEASAAVENGNHPFGAALVVEGEVVLCAQNTVCTDHDVTCHAEMNLVRLAQSRFDGATLRCATLYSSTSPCAMCSGAIYWARIGKVVYGCEPSVLGEIAGDELFFPLRESMSGGVLHKVDVVGPVLGEEAAAAHRAFWPSLDVEC